MSAFVSFASSAAATNPNITYETLGWDTGTADAQTVTASGSVNTKGSYSSIGTTASAWAAFWLRVLTSSSSGARFLLDLSFDGSTVKVPNIYLPPPGTTGGSRVMNILLPLQVPASTNLRARVSSSTASAAVEVTAIGMLASSTGIAPGFANAAALVAADEANTRPGSTSINATTGATTWTEIEDSTTDAASALLFQLGHIATPSVIQQVRATLATGAALSETAIGWLDSMASTGNPVMTGPPVLIQQTVGASTRLSVNVQAASAGAPDTFTAGVIRFYD